MVDGPEQPRPAQRLREGVWFPLLCALAAVPLAFVSYPACLALVVCSGRPVGHHDALNAAMMPTLVCCTIMIVGILVVSAWHIWTYATKGRASWGGILAIVLCLCYGGFVIEVYRGVKPRTYDEMRRDGFNMYLKQLQSDNFMERMDAARAVCGYSLQCGEFREKGLIALRKAVSVEKDREVRDVMTKAISDIEAATTNKRSAPEPPDDSPPPRP